MTDKLFLTDDGLVELTGKKQVSAQKKALQYLGITYKELPTGKVRVLLQHVQQHFGCANNPRQAKTQPNWDNI